MVYEGLAAPETSHKGDRLNREPVYSGIVGARSRGYELEPLHTRHWPKALELLQRSYPHTSMVWWSRGLQRLLHIPPNDKRSAIGMQMHGPRGLAGVALLFDSDSRLGLTQRQVNASSWAIDPADRMQAPWMARQGLSDLGTTYTAITPVPSALRILQRMGFKAVSHQRLLVVTPRAAGRIASSARVLDRADALHALRDKSIFRALEDHDRLGCTVCAVEMPDRLVPLVLRQRRQSRILPLAEVIYAPAITDILTAIVPLSRFLLRRGIPLLEFEAHEDTQIDIPCTRLFRRRFASGAYANKGIDHLYSELVYLQNS